MAYATELIDWKITMDRRVDANNIETARLTVPNETASIFQAQSMRFIMALWGMKC